MSPMRTSREALAGCPLHSILPDSHARAASERVLKNRAAQSHLSILRDIIPFSYQGGIRASARRGRGRHESIAETANGEQVAGPRGVVFEVTPEANDEIVDRSCVRSLVEPPDFVEHHLAGYRLALVLDQESENVGFHQGQRKSLVANAELQKIEMHGLVAECEGLFWFRRHGRGAFVIQRS